MNLALALTVAMAAFVPSAFSADRCSAPAVQASLNSIVGYDTNLLNGGSIYPHCFAASGQRGDPMLTRLNRHFFPGRQRPIITARDICGLNLADTIQVIQVKIGCH